jgi:hypothetical protein
MSRQVREKRQEMRCTLGWRGLDEAEQLSRLASKKATSKEQAEAEAEGVKRAYADRVRRIICRIAIAPPALK